MKKTLLTKILFAVSFVFTLSQAGAANYYWVGGSGNWSSYATHWATTSGGNVFHTQVPSSFDNVYFDANSFTAPGQIVTNDTTIAYCRDMDWTGATNNPVYEAVNSTIELKVFGSLTLNPFVNFSFNGKLTFTSFNTGKTIETFGRVLQCPIEFNGAGGEWTLLDSLTTIQDIKLTYGTVRTNNNNMRCLNFYSANTNVRALYLGTSTVWITDDYYGRWHVYRSLVLDADSSIIRFKDGGEFYSEGYKIFNIIQWDSTNSGSNNTIRYDSLRINKAISYNSYANSKLKIENGYQVWIDSVIAMGSFYDDFTSGNEYSYVYVNHDSHFRDNYADSITTMVVNGNAYFEGFSGNFLIHNLTVHGNLQIDNDQGNLRTFDTCYVGGNASILSANNRLGVFTMTPGKTLTLKNDSTNYIDSLIASGTPGFPIQVISFDLGHAANVIIQEDLCTDYLYIHAVHASGNPALFVGANSNDVNNNTGWIFSSNCITGMEEYDGVYFSLYPNPATNEIKVQSMEFQVESVEVYDVMGKKRLALPLNPLKGTSASIDVSALASGIYFVKVKGEKEERVGKFVKQ